MDTRYKKERWSGNFKFSTDATFDLTHIVSANSCTGKLLFNVLDHVSNLDLELQVTDWGDFIEETKRSEEKAMAELKTPQSRLFYATLYNDPEMHDAAHDMFKKLRNAFATLEKIASLSPQSKEHCQNILEKV